MVSLELPTGIRERLSGYWARWGYAATGVALPARGSMRRALPPSHTAFVYVIAGAAEDADAARLAEGRRVFELLRAELPPGRAAKLASEISGAPRNALYTT